MSKVLRLSGPEYQVANPEYPVLQIPATYAPPKYPPMPSFIEAAEQVAIRAART